MRWGLAMSRDMGRSRPIQHVGPSDLATDEGQHIDKRHFSRVAPRTLPNYQWGTTYRETCVKSGMTVAEPEDSPENDLIDRLMSHDICYFNGDSRALDRPTAPLAALLIDLVRSRNSRLRSALLALLLRHPEHASIAETVARNFPAGDPAGRLLLLAVLAAAALQSEWSFTFNLYLPGQKRIEVDHLAVEFGLPLPRQDHGRTCLRGAAEQLRKDGIFPVNYVADWENAAHRLIAQLVQEARLRAT